MIPVAYDMHITLFPSDPLQGTQFLSRNLCWIRASCQREVADFRPVANRVAVRVAQDGKQVKQLATSGDICTAFRACPDSYTIGPRAGIYCGTLAAGLRLQTAGDMPAARNILL